MTDTRQSRISGPTHEFGIPVFPYGASAYSAFSAVIQGFALGALGFQLNSRFATGPVANDVLVQAATACLLIWVIWHRYITHLHFVAWLPRWSDTLVLFAWAIVEFGVMYTSTRSAALFSSAVACAGVLGGVSYVYVWLSFWRPIVDRLFHEHYTDQAVARAVIAALRRFNVTCLWQLSFVSAGLVVVALAIHYAPAWVEWFSWTRAAVGGASVIIFYAVAVTCGILAWRDLQWYLRRNSGTTDFLG